MLQELSTISNDLTSSLPSLTFRGEIVVVDSDSLVEDACRDLASHRLIGFDTETRPSFKAGVIYTVSLLQLSTPSRCYLFRLHRLTNIDPIIKILESEYPVKLGADVAGDIRSLNQLRELKAGGFYDLQNVIWEWGIGERSLRKMSALVLGHKISKAQRLSNWEAATLTPQQQIYAATDAWACIEIYNRLLDTPKLTQEQIKQIETERAHLAAEAAAKKATKEQARRSIKRDEQNAGEQKEKRRYRGGRIYHRRSRQKKTSNE